MAKQGYTMFLGGARSETLSSNVSQDVTVSKFLRGAGVTISGSLVEYQLSEIEDLKTISLLIQPSSEKKYECRCLKDKDKLPMHIFRGGTVLALSHLAQLCSCNLNFIDYYKNKFD